MVKIRGTSDLLLVTTVIFAYFVRATECDHFLAYVELRDGQISATRKQ